MKKLCFLFLLILLIFSCKSTPKKDKGADDSGLSQLDLTVENKNDEQVAGFDDDRQPDAAASSEDALTQDAITDDSESAEKPAVVEAVDEVKEVPKPEEKKPPVEEKKPPAPAVKPAPPSAVTKTEPPPAEAKADEEPSDEKKDDSENAEPPPPPPRIQQVLTPPPAVTAVKDDAPVPNQRGPVLPKEEIIFSRIVNAFVGQLVEIPFRGTGWVYMGEIASKRGLPYNSRRFDIEGQSIIFTAEEAGTYALKFFKHDVIRDYILNDYVQVIVSESPNRNGNAGWFNPTADRSRVTAEPRWPSALEEEAMLRGGPRSPAPGAQPAADNKNGSSAAPPQTASSNRDAASQAQGTTVPQSTASAVSQGTGNTPPATMPQTITPMTPAAAPAVTPTATPMTPTAAMPAAETPPAEKQEKLPPEEILKKAQDAFNGGNAADAIALLNQYNEFYPGGNDELYWLFGQFYEANTSSRNILLSLDYYRRLIDEYPQSRRYNDARRRIAYLERFYINIQ